MKLLRKKYVSICFFYSTSLGDEKKCTKIAKY